MLEEIPTFDSGIKTARGWAKLKIDISTCEALREGFRDAANYPELAVLLASYNAAEPEVRRDLSERIDWAAVENTALVLVAETYFAVKRAVRDFLPAPLDRLSLAEKWQWFVAYFLWRGAQLRPANPLYYALSNAFFIQVGPGAVSEIKRRFGNNLGAFGGAISYLSDPDIPYVEGLEKLLDRAADRIGKSALKAILKKHVNYYDAIVRLDQDELRSQVHQTWLKDFYQDSPAGTLALSLNGKYSNRIGAAVACDLIDRIKSEQAGFERAIDLEADKTRKYEDFEYIKFKIEDLPIADADALKAEILKAEISRLDSDLNDFAREYPKEGKALRAEFEGITQRDNATQQGVTDRAIRKRLKKAEEVFTSWLRAKYPGKFLDN